MLSNVRTSFFIGLLFSSVAAAQNRPPFTGGPSGSAYDPEISVVNSGAITDVQVAVTDDLRYVTINARVSKSSVISLNTFQVAQARLLTQGSNATPQGFVGNAGFLEPAETSDRDLRVSGNFHGSPTNSSPSSILKINPNAIHSMLRSEGMFRLTIDRPQR